jgi:hypothetical protein
LTTRLNKISLKILKRLSDKTNTAQKTKD